MVKKLLEECMFSNIPLMQSWPWMLVCSVRACEVTFRAASSVSQTAVNSSWSCYLWSGAWECSFWGTLTVLSLSEGTKSMKVQSKYQTLHPQRSSICSISCLASSADGPRRGRERLENRIHRIVTRCPLGCVSEVCLSFTLLRSTWTYGMQTCQS